MDTEQTIERPQLTLTLLPQTLAICRLDHDAPIPDWACRSDFFSITRTPSELSIVCPQASVPAGVDREPDWRAFTSRGPLGFTLTGLIESLAEPLAVAGISIFAISTHETDYLLVKQTDLQIATLALKKAGHDLVTPRR